MVEKMLSLATTNLDLENELTSSNKRIADLLSQVEQLRVKNSSLQAVFVVLSFLTLYVVHSIDYRDLLGRFCCCFCFRRLFILYALHSHLESIIFRNSLAVKNSFIHRIVVLLKSSVLFSIHNDASMSHCLMLILLVWK